MLEFDEATHTYKLDGREVPSVTRIIAPLYGNAFDFIPTDVLERKRRLGQALHKATELDDQGNLDEESLSPELLPYLQGWRKFRRDHRVQVLAVEQKLASKQFGFAGTIDRILRIDGTPWTIDLKTTVEIHRAVGVQLAGYHMLAGYEYGDTSVGALRLLDDGTYRLEPFDKYLADDRRCFMGLLSLFNWKSKYQKQIREREHA